MDLTVGTFLDVTTAANLTQGVLNTFGDSLKNIPEGEERIKYVTDLLAHTFRTTRVDGSELSQVLGIIGGASQGLNIDLNTVLGTVGFLSNGMLQGRRAAMALLAIFSDMASNADKLKALGLVFDVRQPADFMAMMEQLKKLVCI